MKFMIIVGGLLLFPLIATPLLAQDTQDEVVIEAQDADQPIVADQPSQPPASKGLDEVVVTAQKRAEDVQDVPISISAISAEDLELKNIADPNSLQLFTPNVNVFTSSYFNLIFVRGMGSDINQGFETSVGLFVDGIYYGRSAYFDQDYFDLSRIELLRGPQGAVFGKNTIAGAMNVVTQQPIFEWSGNFAYMLGEFDKERIQAALNVPIIEDKLSIRLSGNSFKQDGFVYNTKLDQMEPKQTNQAWRASIRFKPIERLDLSLQYGQARVDTDGQGAQLTYATDEHLALFALFDPEVEDDPLDNQGSSDAGDWGRRDLWHGVFTVNYEAGEYVITAISGLTGYKERKSLDVDFSPAPVLILDQNEDYDQFSQEVRVTSPLGEHFDWIGGLYYFYSEFYADRIVLLVPVEDSIKQVPEIVAPAIVRQQIVDAAAQVTPVLAALLGAEGEGAETSNNRILQTTETYSAFFQGNWRPSFFNNLQLTAGLRYTYEIKEADQELELTGPGQGLLFPALIPGTEEFTLLDDRKESFLLPRFAATYHWTDDIMTFFQMTWGQKAGGFNADAANASQTRFDEETSISYEAGVRSEFFGGLARFNVTGFWSVFDDLQVSTFNGQQYVVRNAATAITRGVEIEAMAMVLPGLILTGNYGWIDGYYDSFPDGPCPATSDQDGCDLSGRPIANAADQTAALAFILDWPLDVVTGGMVANSDINFFLTGEALYQGFIYNQTDLDPLDTRDPFWVFNARFGLHEAMGLWSFTVHATNLTATEVVIPGSDVPVFEGSHFGGGLSLGTQVEAEFRVKF